MPYYSTSNARDPLYDRNEPSAKYYGQFRASEAKPPQSYYQPPQPANGGSNVNTNTPGTPPHPNPLLHDDEAFIKATESLLQKRKMTLLSGTKFMYSKMDPLERSQFAAAYSRRYQRMPMFPAADETVLQRWMRRIEEDFGDAFLQVVGDGDGVGLPQRQLQQQQQQLQQQHHQLKRQQHQQLEEQQPSYHQEGQPPPSFNSNPNAQRPRITNNEHSSRQYRQPPPPIRQEHRDNYDEEHLVHSSRPASYSNRDGIPNNSHAPLPRRKDRRTKSPSRRHGFEPTQQAIDVANLTAAAPYTPTSILKKSRLGREPVAQIMEVLPPAAPSNVASSSSSPRGSSSVLKLQSTTRQSIMQEIAYVNNLLATMPNSDGRGNSINLNDNRAYYTEHLWSLKEQLHLLTTNGNEDSERILTYDGPAVNQVLDAVLNLNTNESIVEMDEIVGPAPSSVKRARESSPSPKRGGDRQLQSNAPQRSRRRSKERNFENSTSPNEERPGSALERGLSTGQDKTPVDASIPKVISFEQSPASNHAIAAAQHQWDDDDDMTNSIVERGTLDVGPTIAKEIPSVRVVAPANLPGGYQIDAQLNNESFKVTVPEGGVSMGQTFEAKPTSTIRNAAGESRWKAGLFDCLALGIVHPIFCNSFFFPQVALTQILTRLRISPLQRGQVASSLHKRLRIKTVLLLSTAFFLLDLLLICTMIWPANTAAKIFSLMLFCLCNIPAAVYFCYWVVQTRRQVRAAYNIPAWQRNCEGGEDVLASVFCLPCSVAQMMQQTADYDTYRAIWCSESGLPNHSSGTEKAIIPTLPSANGPPSLMSYGDRPV